MTMHAASLAVASRADRIRKETGLSVRALAHRLDVSVRTAWRLLRPSRSLRLEEIVRLASALGVRSTLLLAAPRRQPRRRRLRRAVCKMG